MADSNIGLRISGTKQRQAGFVPLVSCGILAGNAGENMDRVTMVAEKPVYIIRHAPEYILYQLIDRQVKSFDADASGVLSIALTIPSNMQLANQQSPYRLLRDIYEKFQETCMERLSDGRDSFKNMDNDSDIFREIVARYSLEERKTGYVVMNPQGLTGITCVSPNDLDVFFKNTQYEEFRPFKDIEIGINCQGQVSAGLDQLQIPLPLTSYEVWVNDRPTGQIMQSYSDRCIARDAGSGFYSYESVEFTLGELWDSNGELERNGARIHLNSKNNRIYCNLKKVEVSYQLKFEWSDKTEHGKNEILSLIKKGEIKVLLGSKDISHLLFEENPRLKALEVKGKDIVFRPPTTSAYILTPQEDVDDAQCQVVIRIFITQRKQFTPPTSQPKQFTDQTSSTTTKRNNNPITNQDVVEANHDVRPASSPKKSYKSFITGGVVGLLLGLILGFVGTLMWLNASKEKKGHADDSEDKNPTEYTENVKDSVKKIPQTDAVNDDGNKAIQSVIDKIAAIGTVMYPESNQKITEARTAYDALTDDQRKLVYNSQTLEEAGKQYKELEKKAIIAQAELQRKAAEEKANSQKGSVSEAEILKMVNSREPLTKIRKVCPEDKIQAIEAIYKIDSYSNNLNTFGQTKLNDIKKRSFSFSSFDDVKKAQEEMWKIILDKRYKN